jgi:hypothetical protein
LEKKLNRLADMFGQLVEKSVVHRKKAEDGAGA